MYLALGFEDEQPEYDLDEEDSEWLANVNKDKASEIIKPMKLK